MQETREAVIEQLRQQARKIAARQPQAAFYRDCSREVKISEKYFRTDPVAGCLYSFVAGAVDNEYGHGLAHARLVALDAAAIVAVECRREGFSDATASRRMQLAHCAGLLHDIERRKKYHARQGAAYARRVLSVYPFAEDEVADICTAIANHEAFGEFEEMPTISCKMLSDCLYDSDKFRFGPDNFTHTVWDMVELSGISLERFASLYPRGIEFLEKIRYTFRSPTGKKYGPQFIDIGLAIGEQLYHYMKNELRLIP
ncbi:MAG: HD domain-containing protein [Desulfosalsimonadaceae bacterium]